MSNERGKILVTYHKRFPLLRGEIFLPVYLGKNCGREIKEGTLSDEEKQWLNKNLIGDDTGDNISEKNREYCECTGLYWFWKNYEHSDLDYVGVFQYRRQLILNELFNNARDNREKNVYKCVHLDKNCNVSEKAGISDIRIRELLKTYDYIVPLRASLEKASIKSVYEDYVKRIPGVHISDIVILEKMFSQKFPDLSTRFNDYLRSPNKMMYQIFLTKPKLLDLYCEWLFDLLFLIEKYIDTSLYSINGRRTMGYLAEILYGFYFTNIVAKDRVYNTGVTYLD